MLNQCNFIGRIGKDIDLRQMPSGAGGDVNFSIACGDDYKNKDSGAKVEQTNWINIVAYGRLAEIISEYCGKGSQIFITGKQTTNKWQDKEGNTRYTTQIVAKEIKMLGGRSSNNSSQAPQQRQESRPSAAPNPGGYTEDFDDDIPFS